MRRRALLAALAAGTTALSGCPSLGGERETVTPAPVPSVNGDASETPRATDRPSETDGTLQRAPPNPAGSTSVVAFETVPQTYALGPTVTTTEGGVRTALWFDAPATANRPAIVRGWLRNRGEESLTIAVRDLPVVGRTTATRSMTPGPDARIHLAPTGNNAVAATVPTPTQADDGRWVVEADGPWMGESVDLDVAEWVELEYALVGDPGTARPTGSYEFSGETPHSIVAWSTPRPGPETTSRFADRSAPSVRGEGVEWFHEAGETTTLYLRPSTERAELDATVTFETVNHTRRRVACGPWELLKLVDGRWHLANPFVGPAGCPALAPGERRRFALDAHNERADACADDCGPRDLNRGYLGGGTYGVVRYGAGELTLGAVVELVGDPVTVRPTGAATVERDGDTVVVTRPSHDDGASPPDDSFALARTGSASYRTVPERLMVPDIGDVPAGVRDGISAFDDGVDSVVVRADERVVDGVVGQRIERTEFVVGEQAYVASRTVERS